MKKFIGIILVIICLGGLIGCYYMKDSVSGPSQETVVNEADDTLAGVFQTQTEINETSWKACEDYEDSIENEFQELTEALPEYKTEFDKERDIWEKYQKAVREVAGCEDHGSSTPMYVADVLSQATKIRGLSLHNMYLQTQGKGISTIMTTFTPAMIEEAYSAYIKAVGEDEYMKQKSKYQKSLRKEQKCWEEWVECRKEISQMLTGEIKNVYDFSTNQMLRTKLYQLKNQNRDLGLTSEEIIKCALPENCSDKVLLEYPGFDKVWAKHCEEFQISKH